MPILAADVLLLTATPVESKATLQAFAAATQHQAVPQSLDGRIYFDLGTVNGARVCLTQSEHAPDLACHCAGTDMRSQEPSTWVMNGPIISRSLPPRIAFLRMMSHTTLPQATPTRVVLV